MFGIGFSEVVVLAGIAACPLVLLYIALYMTRRMGYGGINIPEQTLILEALERRMTAMEERMTAMERLLPRSNATE